jgi:hypothetical protein
MFTRSVCLSVCHLCLYVCCLVSGDIKIAEEDLLSQRTKSGADDEETETKMFVCVCMCVSFVAMLSY